MLISVQGCVSLEKDSLPIAAFSKHLKLEVQQCQLNSWLGHITTVFVLTVGKVGSGRFTK